MKQELKSHISKNLPFLKGKKLLIAISGGIDSVVMTKLFYDLKYDIGLAHCNFSLRGKESNKDETFVKTLGSNLGFETHTIKFDTNEYAAEKGLSTQMAARELRYNYFQSLCEEFGYDYVLTAHHQDDVLETFLINLTRGTGLEGLTGIPEINGNIVRPLLPFNQNDILLYATKQKLTWREDQSNSSLKYVRNRIRHKVVPVLKELNPSMLESFKTTTKHLGNSQIIVNQSISNLKKKLFKSENNGAIHISIPKLEKLKHKEVYLYELFNEYGFTAWNDIAELLSAQTGKKVLSKTHFLLKNREELILSEIREEERNSYKIPKSEKRIDFPISLTFEKVNLENTKIESDSTLKSEILIDSDLLEYPLELRKWQKGDFFYPIGMRGKKKVSKYFKDEKLSAIDKQNVWILCSGNDIIWIVNHRMDNRFKISKTTKKALKIKS